MLTLIKLLLVSNRVKVFRNSRGQEEMQARVVGAWLVSGRL